MDNGSKVRTLVHQVVTWRLDTGKNNEKFSFPPGSVGICCTINPHEDVTVRFNRGIFASYKFVALEEISEDEYQTALLLDS